MKSPKSSSRRRCTYATIGVFATLLFAVAQNAGARTLAEVKSVGTISMCANRDALPYASNKPETPGFQIEIGRADAILRAARAFVFEALDALWEPIEEHLAATAQHAALLFDRYVVLASGGSSGTRGIFVMATGPRATTDFMESLAAATRRPAFMVTVLTMYNDADPDVATGYYERCAAARARGNEVYIHTACQPLSFDFTLRDPYLMFSHDAFARVKTARPEELPGIYADPLFRQRFRENLASPQPGILFYGDWSKVEVDEKPVSELARAAGRDPLDWFFDLPLETPLIAKLFQNAYPLEGNRPAATNPEE